MKLKVYCNTHKELVKTELPEPRELEENRKETKKCIDCIDGCPRTQTSALLDIALGVLALALLCGLLGVLALED